MLVVLDVFKYLYDKVLIVDLEEDWLVLFDEVVLGVCYDDIDDYLEGWMVSDVVVEKIEVWYLKIVYKCYVVIIVFDDFWK